MSDFEGTFVVSILDYGAGNVQSLRNVIKHLGYQSKDICNANDILTAQAIIFPGQGCFGQAMESLRDLGLIDVLRTYIKSDRPFFGICLGMQLLFDISEESPNCNGLSIIPGKVTLFDKDGSVKVPQIGWNGMSMAKSCSILDSIQNADKVYFVHSFCALPNAENLDWILTTTDYGSQKYISSVQKGNIFAVQFHPEKSGRVGIEMIKSFLNLRGRITNLSPSSQVSLSHIMSLPVTSLTRRIVACLDVRTNDDGDLVVTKGEQYDVRELAGDNNKRGSVRNLGKPVALCKRYYDDGADEVVFLNITSFRQGVLEDAPMLHVLKTASTNVFVPLTVGGGIRDYTDPVTLKTWSALEVAAQYFRAGADKVSIGGDAVIAAEEYMVNRVASGRSSIEQISSHYGAQAVVVSIDPKRVYVDKPEEATDKNDLHNKTVVKLWENETGPHGENYCWWQVTVKGGREARDVDAIQVAKICELLGAGEIMLNCIDMDGQGQGYDIPLIRAVEAAVSIPVIASSGAGKASHFVDVFESTTVNAALAAGIFHRNECSIGEVKSALEAANIPVRVR